MPWRFKGSGIRAFYPIINMTEEKATAPENWTEPSVSCCGQRAPQYPQCTTGRLHQRHNTMFSPCLHWKGLRVSFLLPLSLSVSLFFAYNAYNSDIWFEDQNKYTTHMICCSVSSLKIFRGNFRHVFWPLTLPGHFHFPPSTKWGVFWSLISCFCGFSRWKILKFTVQFLLFIPDI